MFKNSTQHLASQILIPSIESFTLTQDGMDKKFTDYKLGTNIIFKLSSKENNPFFEYDISHTELEGGSKINDKKIDLFTPKILTNQFHSTIFLEENKEYNYESDYMKVVFKISK